jgi:hypothetical protein
MRIGLPGSLARRSTAFRNVVQCSAELSGGSILEPVGVHFLLDLGIGLYGHGPCLHSLQNLPRKPCARLIFHLLICEVALGPVAVAEEKQLGALRQQVVLRGLVEDLACRWGCRRAVPRQSKTDCLGVAIAKI